MIGSNSIAIYVMSWTIEHFISSALIRHFGTAPFLILGPAFEPVLRGIGVLIVFWLILYWMYRRQDLPAGSDAEGFGGWGGRGRRVRC